MSRICELTGKRPSRGYNVSNSNRHTKKVWYPNLKVRSFFVPEVDEKVKVKLSTSAIRTIDKVGGFTRALMKAKEDVLSPRLRKLQKQVYRQRVEQAKPKASA